MILQIATEISSWLTNYLKTNKLECFVVGVSGGVDSALVSTLCAQTGIKTIVLNLPLHSKQENTSLSDLHCNWLKTTFKNVEVQNIDLSETFDSFRGKILETTESNDLCFANAKSRLRMITLYYIAGAHSGLVVGTGNKVEDFGVGFYTKYGDGGVDISPIADLSKTQVRKMATTLGVRLEILSATPTDGLWEDSRTDEQQIGASYEELEWAMSLETQPDISTLSDREKQVLQIYDSYNQKNKHKMEPIPVFKLRENF